MYKNYSDRIKGESVMNYNALNLRMLLLSAVILSVSVIYTSTTAHSEPTHRYTSQGLTFEAPVPFSLPSKLGVDAQSLVFPAQTKPGMESFEIVLVSFSKGALALQKMTEKDLVDYVKTTFLGAGNGSGKNKTQRLMGKNTVGELCETSIPKPSLIEVYPLTLKDGSKAVIAFKYRKDMDVEQAESIVKKVAETLKEAAQSGKQNNDSLP